MSDAAPVLLKTVAAAARLGIHPRTLQQWAETMPEVRAAKFRRGFWRVAILDKIGGAK